MDTVFTKDGIVRASAPDSRDLGRLADKTLRQSVIWHDHRISELKCKDTAPGGENFPYVGKLIANLTLAELKVTKLHAHATRNTPPARWNATNRRRQTLDCGSLQLAGHQQAKLFPGAQIPTLEEVLELVECYGDDKVEINLEVVSPPPPLLRACGYRD
jgi:glycerophosphoryl diester phosphodiesterase